MPLIPDGAICKMDCILQCIYIYISRHMVACHATQEVSESHHEYIDKNNNAIFTHVQLHAAYETIQF